MRWWFHRQHPPRGGSPALRAQANARRNASPVTTTAAIPTPTATACAVTHATNANNAITKHATSVATTTTATTRPPSA